MKNDKIKMMKNKEPKKKSSKKFNTIWYCPYCGSIIFKTGIFPIGATGEVKCQQCKKLIDFDDLVIKRVKRK